MKAGDEKPISGDSQRSSLQIYDSCYFVASLTSDVEGIVIKAIQKFFDKNVVKDLFKWDISTDLTKVFITAEFRDDEQFFPQIIVSNVLATERVVSFGQKLAEFDHDDKHYIRFGGQIGFDVIISVVGSDPATRNELGDMLFLGMMYPLRRYLEQQRLIIETNSLRMMNRGTAQLTNEKLVHTLDISFKCFVEWKQDFLYDSYTLETVRHEPVDPGTEI